MHALSQKDTELFCMFLFYFANLEKFLILINEAIVILRCLTIYDISLCLSLFQQVFWFFSQSYVAHMAILLFIQS